MMNDGFSSVKSTPFLIRSFLLGISVGDVFTESVTMSVLIYSISSQYLGVVVDPLLAEVPRLADAEGDVVLLLVVVWRGVSLPVPCVDAGVIAVVPSLANDDPSVPLDDLVVIAEELDD